jgi:hypothetical protein
VNSRAMRFAICYLLTRGLRSRLLLLLLLLL